MHCTFAEGMLAAVRARAGSIRYLPVLAAIASAVAGCAPAPGPASLAAADASAHTPPVAYRPVTAGYDSRRPVGPDDWRGVNRRVAPSSDDR